MLVVLAEWCRGFGGVLPHGEPPKTDTMGVMDRDCAACHQPISDEDEWFRVREEYVHISCAEKFLRRISERRRDGMGGQLK